MGQNARYFPTKEVTRAEAAKIIAYLMVGNSREADALKTTSDPFSDVSKNHWAAGYIAYLVQEGVLDGVGNGKFDPNGKVTGLAFAKMLLTALGYGVNDEYVGSEWAINVAKDALNYGIYDGNLAGANNEAATREECALYAFNSLWLNKVTYSALLGGYIENGYWQNAESNKADCFANDFNLYVTDFDETETDAFERPVGYYYYIGRPNKQISDVYGADDYLVATYTTPVKGGELYSLLGRSVVKGFTDVTTTKGEGIYEVNVYHNGTQRSSYDELSKIEAWIGNKSSATAMTGYGVETYVYVIPAEYDNDGDVIDNAEVRICVIDNILVQVEDVIAETKSRDPKTTVIVANTDKDDMTGIENLSGESMVVATDEYEVGDYLLAQISFKGTDPAIASLESVTTLTSTISKYTNKGVARITADGETYIAAANDYVFEGWTAAENGATAVVTDDNVDGNEYVLYIDENGYLIGVDSVKADTTYVYVAQFGVKANTTASSIKDTYSLVADIYYADGTNEILPVDTSDATAEWTKAYKQYLDSHEDKYIKALNCETDTSNDDPYGLKGSALGLYKLEISRGKAVLSREAVGGENYHDENGEGMAAGVTKGISRLMKENKNDWYATTSTVFFYVSGKYNSNSDPLVVTGYTGIKNVPYANTTTYDAIAQTGFYKNPTNDTAVFNALLVENKIQEDDGAEVYFYTGKYTEDEKTVTFDVYLNGEATTLTFEYSTYKAASDAIDDADKLKNEYVNVGANGLVQTYTNGKTVYVSNNEGQAVIKMNHALGDVFEATMYTDDAVTVQEFYLDNDNVVIVDLSGKGVSTANGLKTLAKEYSTVEVAFDYTAKTLDVTTVYVLSAK